MAIHARILSDDERRIIEHLTRSRTAPIREVERANMLWLSGQGLRIPAIAARLHVHEQTVRYWIRRFNEHGLPGLQDRPRAGRRATYTAEERSEVIATALSDPQTLGQPFACWTLDRLQAYLNGEKGIAIKRSRIDEILLAEGLRWRQQETWFTEKATLPASPTKADPPVDGEFAQKRGPSRRSIPCLRTGAQ